MTVIGERKSFAIEFVLNEGDALGGQWLYGHLRFWASNKTFGNYDSGTSLSVGIAKFKGLLKYSGRRTDPELMCLPAETLLDRVMAALFIDSGQSDAQVAADAERYWPFVVAPTGYDVFDGWRAVLVEDESKARFVWQHADDPREAVSEARLLPGEFDRVARKFVLEAESIGRAAGA